MTELLLENAGEVLAIEKDARLVAVLRERLNSKLELLHDDALKRTTNAAEVFPQREPWLANDFTLEEITGAHQGIV